MITQCCQCKKYRVENQWVTPYESLSDSRQISHSYCPKCAEQFTLETMYNRIIPDSGIEIESASSKSI